MQLLRNLSVRASVGIFVSLSLSAIAVLGVLAFVNMGASEGAAERVLGDVKRSRAAGLTDMMHDALHADTLAARLAGEKAGDEEKKALRKDLADHVKLIGEQIALIDGLADEAQVRTHVDVAKPLVLAYADNARKLVEAGLAGKADEPTQKAFEDAFEKLEKGLDELSGSIETAAEANVARQATMFRTAKLSMAAAVAIAATLLVLYGLSFVHTIMRRLGAEPRQLRDLSLRIAQGELGGDFGFQPPKNSVADAMVRMQMMLSTTVRQIRASADTLASTSQQIAQGNLDLSERTEQQASALQQTASTMDELGSTTSTTADHARQANQLAQGASEVAVKGGHVVGQVVDTMKGINDSSRKISDIIGVIDGIAFQTNILALNAAVEAARAGEQGRGFAVVASEVRSLAGRSAEAAREIKGLIGASVERVGQGTALVDEAGATMQEIVGSIRRVTDIMGEISSAAGEQSSGFGLVSQSVNQMDQATQRNAALVEETAAAAAGLKQQASELVQAIAVFKFDDGAGTATGARSLVPAAPHKPARIATVAPATAPENARVPATAVARAPAVATVGADDDWTTF